MLKLKFLRPFVLAMCCGMSWTVYAATAQAGGCQLEQAEALAKRIDHFWSQRDAAGMASLYAQNASLAIEPDLGQANGRVVIQQLFTQIFATLEPGNEHHLTVSRVGSVAGFCTMDARAQVGVPAAGAAAQSQFSGFYLLKPVGSSWQIEAVRAVSLQ